jgi:hypothetical protein
LQSSWIFDAAGANESHNNDCTLDEVGIHQQHISQQEINSAHQWAVDGSYHVAYNCPRLNENIPEDGAPNKR